jgi:6-phosphogluconolactonase (cycloisomerase 2 family)
LKKFEDEQPGKKFYDFLKNDFLNLISVQPLVAQNNLPAAAAAIRLSPDEKFLYVSVRERNVICVFALQGGVATKIQEVSLRGQPSPGSGAHAGRQICAGSEPVSGEHRQL